MGQAIEQTIRLYPGLLESNQNLLFMLKCRQFIEMVNGSDFDLVSTWRLGSGRKNPKPYHFTTYTNICVFFFHPSCAQGTPSSRTSPVQTSVIQSTKSYQNGNTIIPDNAENMVVYLNVFIVQNRLFVSLISIYLLMFIMVFFKMIFLIIYSKHII